MSDPKELTKVIQTCNLNTVSAILTLAETQLVISGVSQEQARQQLQEALAFWEGTHRDDLGRRTDW